MTDFGVDTYCLHSLRTARLVSGVLLVAQNAYHRLDTVPGTLRGSDEDEKYGYDLASKIGSTTSSADAAALPAEIRNELLEDERISEVKTRVDPEQVGPSVRYRITIVGYTDEGPFTLLVGVQDATLELLGMREGAG